MHKYFRDPKTANELYPPRLLRVWRPAPDQRWPVVHLSTTWREVYVHWINELRRNRLCELDGGCKYCQTASKRQLLSFAVVAPMNDLSKHRLIQFSACATNRLLSEVGEERMIHGLCGIYSRLGSAKNSALDFEPIKRIRTGIETYTANALEEAVLRLMTCGKNGVLYS